MVLKVGFSPCPNDTFIWAPIIKGFIKSPFQLDITIADIEKLNELALKNGLDVIKVSCHLLPYILKKYCFLEVGAALGKGCGPIIVTRPELSLSNISSSYIAIPGRHTTAYLLFKLYAPQIKEKQIIFCQFDKIMPKVKNKEVDFGLIIHEGRFLFKNYGLKSVLDLGKWWEKKTKLPLPLGGFVAKRKLSEKIKIINSLLKQSISYAWQYSEKVMPYVKKYASHLEENVIKNHITLYVNEFTLNLGKEGKKAIITLFKMAKKEVKDVFCFNGGK